MSTIFADKFKNTSGGNPVQINQLRGIDTAGSVTVQGEGTATTNLQQGLLKAWNRFDGSAMNTVLDSFNYSSATDNGTGDYTLPFTNIMSNANYAPDAGGGRGTAASGPDARTQQADQITTSQFVFNMFATDADGNMAYVEDTVGLTQVAGDLA